MSACPTCGHTLTTFCPACRGKKGGQGGDRKKRKAVRANLEKARAAKARGR